MQNVNKTKTWPTLSGLILCLVCLTSEAWAGTNSMRVNFQKGSQGWYISVGNGGHATGVSDFHIDGDYLVCTFEVPNGYPVSSWRAGDSNTYIDLEADVSGSRLRAWIETASTGNPYSSSSNGGGEVVSLDDIEVGYQGSVSIYYTTPDVPEKKATPSTPTKTPSQPGPGDNMRGRGPRDW